MNRAAEDARRDATVVSFWPNGERRRAVRKGREADAERVGGLLAEGEGGSSDRCQGPVGAMDLVGPR